MLVARATPAASTNAASLEPRDLADDWRPLVPFDGRMEQRFAAPPSDKDVYNGDLGIVSHIDLEESELTVDFDGREVIYGFTELDELVLAYATTIQRARARSTLPW